MPFRVGDLNNPTIVQQRNRERLARMSLAGVKKMAEAAAARRRAGSTRRAAREEWEAIDSAVAREKSVEQEKAAERRASLRAVALEAALFRSAGAQQMQQPPMQIAKAAEAAEATEATEAAEAAEAAEAPAAEADAARQLAEAAAAERARQELFESEGVVCDDEWMRLELRCVLSFQRLTDPAKGSNCAHRACCNYKELREYAGRVARGAKQCPLATCGARLQRTRDVERDAQMLELLQTVPADVATVWLQDGELRTSDPRARPPPTEGGSVASRKRSSTAAGVGVEPRRSTRRRVMNEFLQ